MQVKLIAAGIILLAMAYFSYQAGADSVRADVAKAIDKARAEEAAKVKEVIKWKEKQVVIYRDKIQKIKIASDPTGCLDVDIRAAGLGSMLPAGQD